ncbi:MAG: hypothetical protein F7C33_02135 [Desulfurococcales archaeon]|nr:hypothetical protein [Desulfurococcales archaeon]
MELAKGSELRSLGTLMLLVALAGALGGVTGARLMHRVQPSMVKKILIALLVLASLEVYIKIYNSFSCGRLNRSSSIMASWECGLATCPGLGKGVLE